MANEYIKRKLFSLEVRGKFGYPWGTGEYRCGFNMLGEENELAGKYQKQHSRYGSYFKKQRYYPEYVTTSPAVLARRQLLRQAVQAWRALTPAEQLEWKKKKYPFHQTGYNRFLGAYLKSH